MLAVMRGLLLRILSCVAYCHVWQGAKYVRHLDNDPLDDRTQVSA